MDTISKISKVMCISLAMMTLGTEVSYAGPGMMEAIDSASPERRNIVGIEISNLTDDQRKATGFRGDGVYVSAVIPGHPAAVAGMKVGDIITKINEWPTTDMANALEVMDGLEAGQKYSFVVFRTNPLGTPIQKLTLNILIEKVQEKAIGKIS